MEFITIPVNPGQNDENVTNLKAALILFINSQAIPLDGEDSAELPGFINTEAGYGDSTKRTVSLFQQVQQLPPNGLIDAATQAAVNKKIQQLTNPSLNITAHPSDSSGNKAVLSPLVFGDTLPAVADLQQALNKLGLTITAEELGKGFLAQTCNALKNFKAFFSIPFASCLVEKQTADKLNERLSARGSQITVPFPLFFGMSSNDVASLQEGLKISGFASSDPAREFGPNTCSAVARFQKEFGIQVTPCYVDEATAKKINELLPTPPPPPDNPPADKAFKVSGHVLNTFSEFIAGKKLVAYDLDLIGVGYYKKIDSVNGQWFGDGMQKLGETTSDDNGYYEIPFYQNDFADAEEDLADVAVFAIAEGGFVTGRSKLSTKKDYADTMLNNWDVFISDANIRGETEYSKLTKAIHPFMEKSRLALHQVVSSEDQIEFLSTETGQDEGHVYILAQADKLVDDARHFELAQELLYGIGRQNIALSWTAISQKSQEDLGKAVQQSISENIIAAPGQQKIDIFLQNLMKAAATFAPESAENANILKTVGLVIKDQLLQRNFLQTYAQFDGKPEDFWSSLSEEQGYTPDIKKSLQFINQLTIITGRHVPLVEQLLTVQNLKDPSDLLQLSAAKWGDLVKNTGTPENVPGDTAEEKAKNYIGSIQNFLNAAYPTKKIASMIHNKELSFDDDGIKEKVSDFFVEAKDFDISTSRVSDFTEVTKKVAGNSFDKVQRSLLQIQRIYQVSPTPEVMNILINKGYQSAYHIASIPQNTFMKKEQDGLGGAEMTASVYNRARHQLMRGKQFMDKVRDIIDKVAPGTVISGDQQNKVASEIGKMISWEQLFGPVNNCQCDDCKSIFSPASHLVDIMQYLDNCQNAKGASPLQVLFKRRPDIGNLLLSCANTNTEIPYIDLVNQVMESQVLFLKSNLPIAAADIGDATATELRAEPQYTLPEAYSTIYIDAVYPFNLPYHQPLDVIRNYLGFLKTSRAELINTFPFYFNAANAATLIPPNAADAETLTLSLKEYGILTNVDFNGNDIGAIPVESYYGNPVPAFTGNALAAEALLQRTGLTYAQLVEILETKFINPGQDVYTVLQALIAGSTILAQSLYDELKNDTWETNVSETFTKLLLPNNITASRFRNWINTVNSGSTNLRRFQTLITLFTSSSDCDLNKTFLHSVQWIYEGQPNTDNNIGEEFLSNLHRFTRLWRKTGWSIHELDTLISAFEKNKVDQSLIHSLALVSKIKAMTDLPLIKLACLWGNIDTAGVNSLYAQLFLKHTGEVSAAFIPNPLNEIITTPSTLTEHLPEICAALAISAEEVNLILKDAGVDPLTEPLSLKNLSVVYRYKLLSEILNVSIEELCLLKSDCFALNPFISADNTFDFIQKVQKLQHSGFSVRTLTYILSGKAKEIDAIAIRQQDIVQALPDLRKKFVSADANNANADTIKTQLKQGHVISFLSTVSGLDPLVARTLVAPLIDGLVAAADAKGLKGDYFKGIDFTNKILSRTDAAINFDWGAAAPDALLPADNFSVRWKGWLCPPADAEYTIEVKITDTDELAALWIDSVKVIDLNGPATAVKTTAGQVKVALTGGKMYPVILEYSEATNNAGIELSWQSDTLPQTIIDTQFLFTDNDVESLIASAAIYHRAAQCINGFAITTDEINYFISNKNDFDKIDFSAFTIVHWFRMYNYTFLRKIIPASSLLPIFAQANSEFQVAAAAMPSDALISVIAGATGWNKDYISYLAGNLGNAALAPAVPATKSYFGFTAGDFKNELPLLAIKRAIDLARRTNMEISNTGLPSWVQIETLPVNDAGFKRLHDIAEEIKSAIKSKYNDNWLTIARQLNDIVRKNQEAALTSYLITKKLQLNGQDVTDADLLYEYLLIDVQMTPIVVTSPLIQAKLAVQLFADRCLLGLENEVDVSAIDPDEWEWMKNYSVAAGLKKLFVYVENYLDPSLRDDKSPFFKDLEAELKKADITDQTVENAFRSYLYKLNEVSYLEICGMYDDKKTQTLHVVARTHAAPYNYYYRIKDKFNCWSPWEQVQLDIKTIENGDNSGVHLMPVVWKKRVFLIWPEFHEKTIKAGSSNATFQQISNTPAKDHKPQQYWELRFAWSEYAGGKWSSKKISKEVFAPFFDMWPGYADQNDQLNKSIGAIVGGILGTPPVKKLYAIPSIPPHCFSFQLLINDLTQELEIEVFVGSEYISAKSGTPVPLSLFRIVLPDITSKLALTSDLVLRFFEALFQKFLIDSTNSPDYSDSAIDSGNYKSYQPFFEHYRLNNEKLTFLDIDFLRNKKDHKIIYSNDVDRIEIEKDIIYPFFYSDLTSNRIYFATPADVSEVQRKFTGIRAPEKAPLFFERNYVNVKSLTPRRPLENGFASPGFMHRTELNQPGVLFSNRTLRSPNIFADTPASSKIKPDTFAMAAGLRQMSSTSALLYSDIKTDYGSFAGRIVNHIIPNTNGGFAFYTFYHPFVATFIKKLNQGGVPSLLEANTAEFPQDKWFPNIDANPATAANDNGVTFSKYDPDFNHIQVQSASDPARNYYLENVDFSKYGAYSLYNWELFFHIPYLIATRLSKNGKYAEARKWFHYIFNPLSTEIPAPGHTNSRYWQVLPFKTAPLDDIISYIKKLQPGYDVDPKNPANSDGNKQVDQWRDDPFNAFLIARNRPIAFMKNVVMSYLDNLIAWADDLFRRYTRESVNEATQLYVLAAQLLGPVPEFIPSRGIIRDRSYNSLKPGLNDFGDALSSLENIFPSSGDVTQIDNSVPANLFGTSPALYFCIPPNDKLLSYWKITGQQLFKIRHGQNIDGIVKPLALYEPPIDPALLLRAKAFGLDIGSILAETEVIAPFYRFSYLLQKAREFCNEVISLGNALLSANEKQDAEELSRTRQTQEVVLLQMVSEIKTRQVLDAQANIDLLNTNRATAVKRFRYYASELLGNAESTLPDPPDLPQTLKADSSLPVETIIPLVSSGVDVSLTSESGVKVIPKEKQELDFNEAAKWIGLAANAAETTASIFHLLPEFGIDIHPFGMGTDTKITGGTQLGSAIAAGARALSGASSFLSAEGNSAARVASFIRREQEWVFQANNVAREIIQIDKQIVSAQIRLQMAQLELDNHSQQIQNARDIEQFLETKFTKQELYQWMTDRLTDVHKQGYQLAYDIAKKAEKAYRFELGLTDSHFIQYGYYQDTYLGITAGEQLQLALNQMDSAFMDNNGREFELTKHISLVSLDPFALVKLMATGMCEFDIPEEHFDLDYTGHYFRKIKSVRLSIPCIAGPYISVSSTLKVTKNSLRISDDIKPAFRRNSAADERFNEINIPFTAIATSTGQNDSGTFELNFRDERYLPFEGAGAASSWQLELNGKHTDSDGKIFDVSQFDYNAIADVILHISYTAREGSDEFKKGAVDNLRDFTNGQNINGDGPFRQYFSIRRQFAGEWVKFLNQPDRFGNQVLSIDLTQDRYPFFTRSKNIRISKVILFAKSNEKGLSGTGIRLLLPKEIPAAGINPASVKKAQALANIISDDLLQATFTVDAVTGTFMVVNSSDSHFQLGRDNIGDLMLVVYYKLSNK